jgi:hypothetical protein
MRIAFAYSPTIPDAGQAARLSHSRFDKNVETREVIEGRNVHFLKHCRRLMAMLFS